MDHQRSTETQASERYVLGEMTEAERFAFEAHYFDCPECAEDVRIANKLAAGLRLTGVEASPTKERKAVASIDDRPAPKKGNRTWLISLAATAALAFITSYQSLSVIPGLKRAASTAALSPIVLKATTRGEMPEVRIGPDGQRVVLWIDVNGPSAGDRLDYVLKSEGESVTGLTDAPPPGMPLLISPNSKEMHPGVWTLTLRDQAKTEVGSYSFRVAKQ